METERIIHVLRHFLAVSSVAFCMACITSCSDSKKETEDANGGVCRIAVTKTMDCLPWYVAVATGIDDGMECKLALEVMESYSEGEEALVKGKVDGVMTDSIRGVNLARTVKETHEYNYGISQKIKEIKKNIEKAKGEKKELLEKQIKELKKDYKHIKADSVSLVFHDNIRYTLFTNVRSRLKDTKQLTDKMIAVDRKGASMPYAMEIVDSARLTDKVFLVNIPNMAIRMRMLANNSVDAAVITEPYCALMRAMGHKMLKHTVTQKDHMGCIAARRSTDTMTKIYNAACDSIAKYGIHHYDTILVRQFGVPLPALKYIGKEKMGKM